MAFCNVPSIGDQMHNEYLRKFSPDDKHSTPDKHGYVPKYQCIEDVWERMDELKTIIERAENELHLLAKDGEYMVNATSWKEVLAKH